MNSKRLGWHFINGDKLRDGTKAPADGKWLEFDGKLRMCESGLHFSPLPHQALEYAPGATLCLVEIGGKVIMGDDKGVCSRRKIIARMDATELLRFYARMQAVKFLKYWDTEPQQVVLDYLMTGDEKIRDTARAAAREAAWDAARDAARAAAWAAAGAAAWDAARAAAWAAALAAANAEFNALVYEAFADFL